MFSIKQPPYHPLYVANHIITYCDDNNLELNNLKLQKILYYLQAKFLLEKEISLFEEPLQKWKYGPVVPSVYHEYKKTGAAKITKSDISPIIRLPKDDETPNLFDLYLMEDYSPDFICDDDKKFMANSINTLSMFGSFELVEETHRHSIWKDDEDEINKGVQGIEYSQHEIIEYFKNNTDKQIWKS